MANQTTAAENRKLKAALDELKDSTRADYRRLAEHFYKTRLDSQPPSPKRIRDALRLSATDYRPDYWRRLRNALMYDQVARDYLDNAAAIKALHNPVTQPKTAGEEKTRESVGGTPGKRQRRIKKLSKADLRALKSEISRSGDFEIGAAVMLAQTTGARPAEMLGIECRDDGTIFIPGAKKGAEGNRGLDRILIVSETEWSYINAAVTHLNMVDPGKAGTTRKVQERLSTLTKRLWPRRKHHPTLYTFRYAMGSELKSSGLSRREVAYIMGHQATASVDKYGNRRSGSGKTPIKAAPGADMSSIRETHTMPFSNDLGYAEGPSLG